MIRIFSCFLNCNTSDENGLVWDVDYTCKCFSSSPFSILASHMSAARTSCFCFVLFLVHLCLPNPEGFIDTGDGPLWDGSRWGCQFRAVISVSALCRVRLFLYTHLAVYIFLCKCLCLSFISMSFLSSLIVNQGTVRGKTSPSTSRSFSKSMSESLSDEMKVTPQI